MTEILHVACPDCAASSDLGSTDTKWKPLVHEPDCPQAALPLLERTFKVEVERDAKA